MPYDKNALEEGRKQGIFEENVFDPKALQLSEKEKQRIHSELSKFQQENPPLNPDNAALSSKRTDREKKSLQYELTWIDKLFVFFLRLFGGMTESEYKLHKIIKGYEREILKFRPILYNPSTKRVTRYLGYKIHDLYLKLFVIKQIFEKTINSKERWNSPEQLQKTGVEIFFESLAGINSREVDSKFSLQGLTKIIADFDSINAAVEVINRSVHEYLQSIEESTKENVNKIYTNILYFKNLIDFDFEQLFKKFDPQYSGAITPNFYDIFGESISPYLSLLEESLLQIDLSLDNITCFKKLDSTARYLEGFSQSEMMAEAGINHLDVATPQDEEKLDLGIQQLLSGIQDILYRNQLALLIRVIRRDPAYAPSFINTKYDFYKIYSESFDLRVKAITRYIIKEKKRKKIEDMVRKILPNLKWVGNYNPSISDQLEELYYPGFVFSYHIGFINTFMDELYEEKIKGVLNVVLMSGVFVEKYFQKSISEFFYSLEKYFEKLRDFAFDVSVDGSSGKKLVSQISKMESQSQEVRKTLDKLVININAHAKELFDEFYRLFMEMVDLMGKIHSDLENKMPRYIRNMHSIGGLKNARLINSLNSSYLAIISLQEVLGLLRE